MTRNLKALGLALVAVLAMAAFAASSASAKQGIFTASSYPVHVFGTDNDDWFEVLENKVECDEATFTAQATGADTKLTVIPTYHKCFKNLVEPVTVTTNGCHYTFTIGTMTSHSHGHGTVDIVCPTKPIEVHSYANHAAHTSKSSNCTLTIGSQNNLPGVTYTNAANGDIVVEGEIKPAVQTHGACSFGITINTTGLYSAGVTVEGTSGVNIDIGTHPTA
jgi:hypothetical protein